MELSLWQQCLQRLQDEIPQDQFGQWISPLQAEQTAEGVVLFAPNRYVLDGVSRDYLTVIQRVMDAVNLGENLTVSLVVGTKKNLPITVVQDTDTLPVVEDDLSEADLIAHSCNLNVHFTFDTFVVGNCNELPKAVCEQVALNPGASYNPLFLYGGVGLGKTHLMHAVGNRITQIHQGARVIYLHSEQFVSDMVKALQSNAISEFKQFYRSALTLMIDDIHFFAGKERSQQELFNIFNVLCEGRKQIILTSDRYPKEISGIEERLKSRFGSGLTIAVQPPELETRVAILMNKAEQSKIHLPQEVAFFIAKRIRSNVRELEGALKRVIAHAHFTGSEINLRFTQEALHDVLALQDKLVSIDNIMRTVADFYKLKMNELLSKRRDRSVARPRQMAMALCKHLTNHSLFDIGKAFGGKDHTTVLHACRQIKLIMKECNKTAEDFNCLIQILTS